MPTKLSPSCSNKRPCRYTGKEPSPKGKGFCAHCTRASSVKVGTDGRKWKVVKTKAGVKRWQRVPVSRPKAPAKRAKRAAGPVDCIPKTRKISSAVPRSGPVRVFFDLASRYGSVVPLNEKNLKLMKARRFYWALLGDAYLGKSAQTRNIRAIRTITTGGVAQLQVFVPEPDFGGVAAQAAIKGAKRGADGLICSVGLVEHPGCVPIWLLRRLSVEKPETKRSFDRINKIVKGRGALGPEPIFFNNCA